ncbi:hypothetical protein SPRG_10790 [Saprolegnia parasitica CBS 223.65]|uniref:Uncharacterized protein n=1 Tax=Saprolegnia parasitica (strain CBS 223.65) TaxID=695850 RepID=A0A067C381_SAPPC|nr:hypothetical protein SPRG_10790 [Saprolegnia parasitica CBS 223.65]KDO23595.1 hypothetical protein SPRG_10790 [Saprolegnia parasitica CBS 223.65]|eukprot:XP_012205743.1 hypothetical protein SPRG_10790 [Saprolegnia parasitica CBS 223.65]
MAIGAYYLVLLSRSFANDLWWPSFNTTGYQLFLVDAINHALEQRLSGVVDLTQLVMPKSYSATQLPVPHPTRARALLLTELTSIEYAILNIRNMSADQSMTLPTLFCYVDFGQRWELAHTVARQARCKERYRFNGAIYLDAIVRNVQWGRLMDAYSDDLNEAVFAAVNASGTDGHEWFTATAAASLSLVDEATHWRSFGVTRFELQWQNIAFTGLQSTMTVVNALGIATTIELQRPTYAQGSWTSNIFNVFFMNEIFFAATCDQSLVRHSTNYIMETQCIYSATPGFEGFLGLSDSRGRFVKQTGLVRDAIGPFLSVDLFVLPPPTALLDAIASFQRVLYQAVQANATAARDYEQLPALSAQPLPAAWDVDEYLYYGGNPMCLNGIGRSYVQSAFTFGDACSQPSSATMVAQPSAILFALSLSGPSVSPMAICISVVSASIDCIRHVTRAIDLTTSQNLINETLSSALTAVISDMQVSLMQFASDRNGSEWTLLTAPILHDTNPLGWVYAYEWATGIREVVSFEGDNGTLVLISDAYQSTGTQDPNTAPLSQASTIVFYMLLYSSVVLVAIAVACTVLAVRTRLAFAGQNLFVFHRVAASTWLGRPLMFLRGACALLLLSTAPVTLTQTNGVSALVSSGRPFYEAIVLAGEANWITYVVYECQLVLHPDGSMGAAAVVWCIYSLLDVLAPVTVATTLERNCSSTDYFYSLRCTNGSISIGSLQRLYVLLGIQVACLLIAICWRHHRTRVDSRRPITVLFSGVANALLHHELDDIGYVLTGLMPLQHGRVFFDVKLWVAVHVAQAPVASTTVAAEPVRLPSLPWHGRLVAVAGFVYVLAAVSSSYSYLQIAKSTLVNDLIWPGFNLSSTHVFLTTCFWGRIAMNQTNGDFKLTDPANNRIGSTDASITSSPTHFGARMHTQL